MGVEEEGVDCQPDVSNRHTGLTDAIILAGASGMRPQVLILPHGVPGKPSVQTSADLLCPANLLICFVVLHEKLALWFPLTAVGLS